MRGKLMFLAGLGAGFVLGSRAGREKYEELVQTARKVRENPTVQEAAGVVQEQANKIVSGGKEKLSNSKLADTKVGEKLISAMETEPGTRTERTESLATAGARSTGTTGTTTGTGTTGTTTTGSATTTPRTPGSNTTTTTGEAATTAGGATTTPRPGGTTPRGR
ncbi:hypothetical protein [Planosporangium thailandense]|uniref:hypothetical protein n=1 Tax=Planosporangium thailandense TaxID=765197 RepID=UPI001F0FBB1F|nr:hypothetical protein [Planosporangium thailandense]